MEFHSGMPLSTSTFSAAHNAHSQICCPMALRLMCKRKYMIFWVRWISFYVQSPKKNENSSKCYRFGTTTRTKSPYYEARCTLYKFLVTNWREKRRNKAKTRGSTKRASACKRSLRVCVCKRREKHFHWKPIEFWMWINELRRRRLRESIEK